MNFAAGGPVTPADSKNLPPSSFYRRRCAPDRELGSRKVNSRGWKRKGQSSGAAIGPGGLPVGSFARPQPPLRVPGVGLLLRLGRRLLLLALRLRLRLRGHLPVQAEEGLGFPSAVAARHRPCPAGVGAARAAPAVLRLTALGPARAPPEPLNRRLEVWPWSFCGPGSAFPAPVTCQLARPFWQIFRGLWEQGRKQHKGCTRPPNGPASIQGPGGFTLQLSWRGAPFRRLRHSARALLYSGG